MLVGVGIVVAMLAIAGALWLFASARQREDREDVLLRLRAIGGGGHAAQVRRIQASDIRNPVVRGLTHQAWRAGLQIDPDRIRKALLITTALLAVIAMLGGLLVAGLILAVVALGVYAYLSRRAAARRSAILEQLPDFLDQILRALSAGNSLEEALADAARDAREPVRAVFVTVSRQVRLGAPVEEALARQGEIHEISDLHVLAMAASVNRQYGGSLRRILKSLIHAIRSRDSAARELRALTAETRLSAAALVFITVGLTLYVLTQNPDYYREMWGQIGTRLMLLFSVLLQAVGVVVIYSMVRSSRDTG